MNATTPERLIEYNVVTGAQLSNVSVTGVSEVVSVRGSPGLAVLELVNGTYDLVDLATGLAVTISYAPPDHFVLTSEQFVIGSASDLVLLYAGPNASKIVLYNASSGATIGTLAVKTDATQAEAIASNSTIYVFDRVDAGIHAFSEVGGKFKLFYTFSQANVASYGIVQAGGSIVIYALSTNGTTHEPTVTFSLAEVPAALAPVPVPSSARLSASASSPSSDYALYLALAAGVVAVILAAVAIRGRRRPPATAATTPPPGTSGTPTPEPGSSPPPPTG